MNKIHVNGLDHYFEQTGMGQPMVFIHGAFADARMWDSQWQYFAPDFRLLRYDLRGHGRTGGSLLDRYSLDTFVDDLHELLGTLDINDPILVGQSFGGSIAQGYATRYPEKVRALVVSGSMVAIDLTLLDKLLCRVLFPEWAMTSAIKIMSVKRFTMFSIWLGELTQGKHFLGSNKATADYLKECMLQMDRKEYMKFWQALYKFKLLALERITCPTLVLNGEFESKNIISHTKELSRRIPFTEVRVIPDSHHACNMDNPSAFNAIVEDFISRAIRDSL
jgi:pimeloyl-ACP methyl ester carboxylesterase